jgi:hypothetical protein
LAKQARCLRDDCIARLWLSFLQLTHGLSLA